MPSPELDLIPKSERSLSGYTTLRSRVREALHLGRKRAEEAVEREKVRTSWEVGKLINEHILLNKDHANYGEQVIKRLSQDIGISTRELHYMMEFARANPILRTSAKLTWSDHEALLRINDDKEREALARRAERENWTTKEIRREITKLKTKRPRAVGAEPKASLLEVRKGIPYTYKIVRLEGKLQIDLGFSNYLLLPQKYAKSFKEGMIVTTKPTKSSFSLHASPLTFRDLFTYPARVLAITDADTLWTFIDLGFGLTTVQQLRLRGIDAPEVNSRDGQAAKRFVERELKTSSEIVITSAKSDKYDRYLADVFYMVNGKEKFLNNELLKRGLAMRVE